MNLAIPIIVNKLKWILNLGQFFDKQLFRMNFTNEFSKPKL
jgi:hypothetical protein